VLAYLTEEPALVGEPAALDPTLAVRYADDGLVAQLAYESADGLEPQLWMPRRRRPTVVQAQLLA
jgi:hypothetical protein